MILSREILTLTIDDELSIYHSAERAATFSPNQQLVFDPDAIVGWDDTPETKRDITARPSSHGDFSSKGLYGAKLVSITGHAIADSPSTLYRMRDTFVSYFQDGQEHEISVSKGGETRYIKASQGSTLSWVQMLDNYAKWKMDLYAADPRMYGGTQRAQAFSNDMVDTGIQFPLQFPINYGDSMKGDSATISNPGNSESWPIYVVNQNMPAGFKIINGGKSIAFSSATFAGTPVTIDTFRGTATVDGSDRSYLLTQRDWTPIPPYGSLNVELSPLGGNESNGWVDITWRPTWI